MFRVGREHEHLSAPEFVNLLFGGNLDPAAQHVHVDRTLGSVRRQMGEPLEEKQGDRQAAVVVQCFLPVSALSRVRLGSKARCDRVEVDLDLLGRKSILWVRSESLIIGYSWGHL